MLDTAAQLFYARGVHEVGMDELVRATGLGKATVYRLFATKDALIGAYLERLALASTILAAIDRDIARYAEDPRRAVAAIFDAVAADLARPEFRGCAFNNASIEFPDPEHPARATARAYRMALRDRLTTLADRVRPGDGHRLGGRLALILDGMYVNAAHLGPNGPAGTGPALARLVLEAAGEVPLPRDHHRIADAVARLAYRAPRNRSRRVGHYQQEGQQPAVGAGRRHP